MAVFPSLSQTNTENYDILIAGSGHAAVSVARRAADRGLSVLLLESGFDEYDDDLQLQSTLMYGRGHFDGNHWPQHWIRSLGGTSAVWAGWCAPLSERNLLSWPINRADLVPYYLDAAKYLRRDPAFLDYSVPFLEGFNYQPFSVGDGRRLINEMPETYDEPPGIDVALRSTLTRLIPREDRRGVLAIEVSDNDGVTKRVNLRENQSIVLAAGGMGNPQILLSSETDGNAAVGNESDQVGRYLMEHPHFYSCGKLLLNNGVSLPEFPGDEDAIVPAMVPDDSVYRMTGALDLSIELSASRPDTDDLTENFLRYQVAQEANLFDLTIRAEMPSEAANRVTITTERDANGLHVLRANLIIGSETYRGADHCLQHLGETLLNANRGRVKINNDNLFHNPQGGGHTMGTTRMGDNAAESVVDRNCRVHGYRNLFVAGSSVFRSGGYANPTLTIIALATRLGDYLGDGI